MAIKIERKKCCTGCEACVQICPVDAINFESDNEGFLYPVVNYERCLECGACEKVCHVVNKKEAREPLKIYAAKNRNEQIREASSSGGIFTPLAEVVIREGGVVFGAKFNEQWEVIHDYTHSEEGLAAFRGSKYVQSRIGDNFKRAKEFLDAGRKVLFSGTPCQIAGLKLFLRREYDNLFTLDLICHGVPSPMVWQKYLSEFCTKNSLKRINYINFRDKLFTVKSNIFALNIEGEKLDDSKLSVCEQLTTNAYLRGFLNELYSRPSCHSCPSRRSQSGSDITIADFWGIENVIPEFDDNKGVSLMIINTSNAEQFIKSIELNSIELVNKDSAFQKNRAYFTSHLPHEERADFFAKINNSRISITKLIHRYVKPTAPTFWEKVVYNLKHINQRFKIRNCLGSAHQIYKKS